MKASLTIHKYGYYPKGMGEVTVKVDPSAKLNSVAFAESKPPKMLKGVSVCTYLSNQNVAERQAKAAVDLLHSHCGFDVDVNVEVVNDFSNPLQKGSSITLWTQTESGGCLGGDAIGELGKPSEAVGREAAQNLLMEIKAGATVDVHLADLLIPYVALADGESEYFTRSTTDHLEANIWLAQKILGVKFETGSMGNLCRVAKKKS